MGIAKAATVRSLRHALCALQQRETDLNWKLLPEWCYAHQEAAALDRARLYVGWHCLGHLCELTEGVPLARMVGSAPVFLQKATSDEVLVFSGLCRHRGMPVIACEHASGGFKCPFHGWSYDASGVLRRSLGHTVKCAGDRALRLHRYEVEIVNGWIFCAICPQAETATQYYNQAFGSALSEALVGIEPLGPPVVRELSFDWKLLSDNAGDAYHFLGTHRNSIGRLLRASGTRFTHGRHWHGLEIPPRHGRPGDASSYSLHLYPHAFIGASDGFAYLERFEAIEPSSFRHVIRIFRSPSAPLVDSEVIATSMMAVMQEDYDACLALQHAYASAPVNSAALMIATPLEEGVWRWQQWWLRRVCGEDTSSLEAAEVA